MVFAEAQEGNANARAARKKKAKTPRSLSPRGFRGWLREDLPEKTAKLKRCNMAIFAHFDRAHNGNYGYRETKSAEIPPRNPITAKVKFPLPAR